MLPRLAKLPEIVLERAKQILEGLELQGDAGIYQPQMMVVEKRRSTNERNC